MRVINAKLIYRGEILDSGLAVSSGRITKLGKEPELPQAEVTLDARGRVILPGAIDAHVHLRDQELSYKETFESGTAAAVAGGVTTVLDMPNNEPPTNTLKRLQERVRHCQEKIHCNVGFYVAPNPGERENRRMFSNGAIGLKVNLLKPIGEHLTDFELNRSLVKVREERKIAVFHAEDGKKVQVLEKMLKARGSRTTEAFLQAHPSSSERSATKQALSLCDEAKARGHIAHVTCEAALREILSAQRDGVEVTSEATPHHLLLDSADLGKLDGLGIMTPPLRSSRDRAALWSGLANGLIDVCATDHAPHTNGEKTSEDVWDISPGVSGLDIFMPLMLSQVEAGKISLRRIVDLTVKRPAEIFGITRRGKLEPDYWADFILVNPKAKRRVRGDDFKSKAKFTPFEGWTLTSTIVATYVNGRCVMSEGELLGKPGAGHVIGSQNDEAEISPQQHAR